MKFMQVHSFYNKAIQDVLARNEFFPSLSYYAQTMEIFWHGFSATHIVAPYMEGVGYNWRFVVPKCMPTQKRWMREHGYKSNPTYLEVLRLQIDTWEPDILYIGDPVTYSSDFIKSLKRRPALVLGWRAASIPLGTDWREFDAILSGISGCRKTAMQAGARMAVHFLPGMPAWASYKSQVVPSYDFSFVGQRSVAHIARTNYWQGLESWAQENGAQGAWHYYDADARFGVRAYQAMRSGRIALDARGEMKYGDEDIAGVETCNARMFEAVGLGMMLLTEYRENLDEMFVVGKEIETFRDAEELVDKVKYYTGHPDERETVARRGMLRWVSDHTMTRRAIKMDEIITRMLA
jgi:hypothetical protein